MAPVENYLKQTSKMEAPSWSGPQLETDQMHVVCRGYNLIYPGPEKHDQARQIIILSYKALSLKVLFLNRTRQASSNVSN